MEFYNSLESSKVISEEQKKRIPIILIKLSFYKGASRHENAIHFDK